MVAVLDKIKEQAVRLARDNKEGDPAIKAIYWFPDEYEVRLIEVEDDLPRSEGGFVEPFYFRASEEDNLPAPSALALIRPDEVGKLELPEGWGDWDSAEKLELDQ